MEYMTRDVSKRLSVRDTFPGVKTVLSLGVSYYQGAVPPKPGPGYGRVARYAWGLDYHDVIQERLEKFITALPDVLGSRFNASVALDTKPLLERALAAEAGLGFIGKNTVLIMPRLLSGPRAGFHVGSFVFLMEILLDIEVVDPSSFALPKVVDGCGGCTKCLTHCPTNAFDGPYKLRSDKCIAYLTIENKGSIPVDMRDKLGDWIFGCDVCQDVCPFNARAYETRWPEFLPDRGVGAWVSLEEILGVPDQKKFKEKWGRTPFSRAKRKGLIRNACVAAGNSGDKNLLQPLKFLEQDAEPVVREHAAWAIRQLEKQ